MVEEAYGIKPHVIGDGQNDLPMIHAYQGFSLVHAHEEVKKQAAVVVESVCECIELLMKTEKNNLY